MSEQDDHMTDALFQAGASRHDFSYEPEAWEQMEALLDAEKAARQRKLGWYFRIGGILLIVGLAVIGYRYWLPPVDADNVVTAEPAISKLRVAPQATATDDKNGIPAPAEDASLNIANAQVSDTTERQATGKEIEFEQRNPFDHTTITKVKPEQKAESLMATGSGKHLADSLEFSVNDVESEKTGSDSSSKPEHFTTTTTQETVQAVSLLPASPIQQLAYPDEWPNATIALADQASPPAVAPFISAGVAAGVVFGGVGASDFSNGAPRLGAKVNYHLSRKIAVGTGLFYNSVKYRASGEEYVTEEGFWTYDVQPESVSAQCDILDIPLSLTYHPRGSDKSGLYVATGLTSYLMLKEYYAYEYEIPNDTFIKDWTEINTNRHYLGLGVLNLGYQRKNGRRSAFQIETFIHLPLQKIGHGQINLFAAGASVNYIFGFNK